MAIPFDEGSLVAAVALSGAKMGDLVKRLGKMDSAQLCSASRLTALPLIYCWEHGFVAASQPETSVGGGQSLAPAF
jgi:hypothetical protein